MFNRGVLTYDRQSWTLGRSRVVKCKQWKCWYLESRDIRDLANLAMVTRISRQSCIDSKTNEQLLAMIHEANSKE